MRNKKYRSIRQKLLIIMVGLILALLSTVTFIHYSSQKTFFRQELDRRIALMRNTMNLHGKTVSDNLARFTENAIAAFDFFSITQTMEKAVGKEKDLEYVILMDSSGVARIHTKNQNLIETKLTSQADNFALQQKDFAFNEFEQNGFPFLEFITPVRIGDISWGVLRLGFSLATLEREIFDSRTRMKEQLENLLERSVTITFLFVFLGGLLVVYGARQITKPLQQLAEFSSKIAEGDFDAKVPKAATMSNDEIGELAITFSDMAVTLKTSYEQLEDYSQTLEQKVEERTSELTKSRRDLQKSLNLTKSISLAAPDAHIIADPAGTILSTNPSAETIFGYHTEELVGKKVGVLTPSLSQDEYTKYIQAYLNYKKSGKPEHRTLIRVSKECTAVRKNGEIFPIMLYVRESRVEGDEVFVGIIEDITDRKIREDRLKKAQVHIQSLIESSMDMIISVDNNRRIIEFNKAAEKAFGYKKEEVVGKDIKMLYADSKKSKFTSIILGEKEHYSSEILNRRKSGEIFPAFISASVLKDQEGNQLGSMGVSRDISEQKRAEEELRAAKQKAETANKAKDEFLANMSHEVRTPLNGIVGMLELLTDTDISENQLSLINTMNTETNSLLNIVNDILDFSKIEAGKLELEEIPFDLRITMDDTTTSFAFKAAQNGLELNSFISPDVPTRLIGDPVRLKQILTNLAGNAMKFTHKGEVYIKGEMAEDLGDRVKLLFSVKDTGIGIPKDQQKAIFESFSQADGSTTRKYGGTGLGTTISKQLTELMGGEIGVESEEGEGSTFFFSAVFTKQKEQETIQTKGKFDLTDKKILILDDHRTNRYILTEHLKSWGCLTAEAYGGREAIDILRESVSSKKPFDLILTDFQMPEMSGFDFTREIRKMESLKEIPIILLTSVGKIGDAKGCKDIGIQGYLTKPIRRDSLRKTVESVLLDPSASEEDRLKAVLVTRHTIAEEETKKEAQILLVEDYPTNQQIAMRHLNRAGYQVDLSENGQQAVEAHKKKHYDIIFMDIQMPVMDGYEATAKIRAREKELETPGSQPSSQAVIIAMTAHATAKDQKKCLESGMDDFISKPLRRRELLAIADKWANKIADGQGSK